MHLVALTVTAASVVNETSDGVPSRISFLSSSLTAGDVTVVDGELASALVSIRQTIGEDALLVTRGPIELRCLIHPQAAREEFAPSAPFMRYIDASLLSNRSFDSPSDDDNTDLLKELLNSVSSHSEESILKSIEEIKLGFDNAICERNTRISDDVIARARGLPWQATDAHVALFFAGLNIAPGGIALCLSVEGRRNGEALIRFETNSQRELALRRHRHFLLARYIEVYRATAEDFLSVAAGSSSEAVDFVSKGAAMIVRMRGLPFDCTEDQIRAFFAEVDAPVVQDGGVMFVSRNDGRPTGDAFVLFETEEQGQKALTRHRHTIGSRYVELFRSSQAEVQQVVKRSGDSSPTNGVRRDSIRLRGLPYEARVEHVVDFLGVHAAQIAPQGVHMVFNAQGHPSGEAFIQMVSESASAAVAAQAHNKFMTIGKKQRYIEVFQCSPDEMNLMIAAPNRNMPHAAAPAAPPAPPLILPQPPHPRLFPNLAVPFGMPHFWPYPSPPVSPNMLLNTGGQILVTGLGVHVTPTDIVAHFSTNPDTIVESVEMVRWATPTNPGEALVRIRSQSMPPPPVPHAPLTLPPGMPHLPLPFPLIHT